MIYVRVKVKAGTRKEEFEQTSSDHFLVSVKEKAERNMANGRVIEIIAGFFKVAPGRVRIVNGHRSPTKLLVVEIGK